jgi:hypothetical protein
MGSSSINPRLISLPTDLLPFIFSFLSPTALCCLDSAILNHTDRPIFLSALIQRFKKKSSLDVMSYRSMESEANWYVCRRIPITDLHVFEVPCPKGMISINSNSLKKIGFHQATLNVEDVCALGQCSNLKNLEFYDCSFPQEFSISSILKQLTRLEKLDLDRVTFSELTTKIICQHSRSLKSLTLSNVSGVGDEELRLLVEGCSSLRSLKLSWLDISEESVRMLMDHRSQIASIGIRYCQGITLESVLSLLREITIPTIFNSDENEELQTSALNGLSDSIPLIVFDESVENFLRSESLLERLVAQFPPANGVWLALISFIKSLQREYHRLVVDSGFLSVLIRQFHSFDRIRVYFSLFLFRSLIKKVEYRRHLVSSGFLSILRLSPLQVSYPKSTSLS